MNIKRKQLKLSNQISLINLIRLEQNISQSELAIRTKLQPSTVSNLVREFKQKGLVKVTGKGVSSEMGGKKSILLSLNNKHGIFSGISVKKESIVISIFDLNLKLLNQYKKSIIGFSSKQIIDLIINEINITQQKYNNFKGIGIAISAVINNKGDIIYSIVNNLKIPHFITEIKNSIPSLPIIVENDANCATYYANHILKAKYKNIIVFSIYFKPFCIGSGIIINHKLFKGHSGKAGELLLSYPDPDNAFAHDVFNSINIEDFKGNHNNKLIEKFLMNLRDYILSPSVFIDTEAIVLCGDFVLINKSILTDFINSLKTSYSNYKIEIINNEDLAAAGAAMMATDYYLNAFLKGKLY